MKRGLIVVGATAAGLGAVLSFHTRATALTLGPSLGAGAKGSTPAVVTGPPAGGGGSGSEGGGAGSGTSGGGSTPTSTSASTTRTATGPQVNYSYGVLSVSVTATGGKIDDVTIASLDDGGNFRSQSIDQQSIPILEQEAISAQSADIQAVSGASYTSAGFVQSLQGALSSLGIR